MNNTSKPSILVIGSSNLDLIMQGPQLPAIGETVTGGRFMKAFGGKGANQAVAAARAGGLVTFLSALGEDADSQSMLTHLGEDGICTDWIAVHQGTPTGTALIMVDENGENYIMIDPGANAKIDKEAIRCAEDVIAKSDWMILQMELLNPAIMEAITLASKHSVQILLNYAPVRDPALPLSPAISGLVVNEVEAAHLLGKPVNADNFARAGEAAELLRRAHGHRFVALTMGSRGVALTQADGIAHIPAYPVKAVDSTAAGDTFCGILSVALAEGHDLPEAARMACAGAALAVTKPGAQTSIPHRNEIDCFLATQGSGF